MEKELIRTLRLNGTTLRVYDLFKTDSLGRNVLGYEFKVGRKVLFQGTDLHCPPCYSIDSLQLAYAILGFLVIGIHDTDEKYFENYTPDQLEWAKGYGTRETLTDLIYDWEEKNHCN